MPPIRADFDVSIIEYGVLLLIDRIILESPKREREKDYKWMEGTRKKEGRKRGRKGGRKGGREKIVLCCKLLVN